MFYHLMWVSFPKCMTHIDLTNKRVNIRESIRKRVLRALVKMLTSLKKTHNSMIWVYQKAKTHVPEVVGVSHLSIEITGSRLNRLNITLPYTIVIISLTHANKKTWRSVSSTLSQLLSNNIAHKMFDVITQRTKQHIFITILHKRIIVLFLLLLTQRNLGLLVGICVSLKLILLLLSV